MTFSLNESIKKQHQPLDSKLLDLISVTPPYFALHDIYEEQDKIGAYFNVEMIDREEFMPITTAEIGRHMAIMGSLALAKYNPVKQKHYYLATKADITRINDYEIEETNLSGTVQIEHCGRKDGKVSGFVYDFEGKKIARVIISYMILHERIFERLFANHKCQTPELNIFNPYSQKVEFEKMILHPSVCAAKLMPIKKEHCLGHFNELPAMPIARLGFAMGKVGGKHFLKLNPKRKSYMVLNSRIEAKRLVFPGEEITIKSFVTENKMEKGVEIKTEVFSNKGDIVAQSITNYI